jgi:cation transport ATPase
MLGRSNNGVGTTAYGRRDFLADGSFVTTKWIIFLYIPLFPLCSMRVRVAEKQRMPDHWLASLLLAFGGVLAFSRSASYVIYSKTRPVLLQVLYVYAFVVAFFLAWWNLGSSPTFLNSLVVCFLLALPWILRRIGRSRARETTDYQAELTPPMKPEDSTPLT